MNPILTALEYADYLTLTTNPAHAALHYTSVPVTVKLRPRSDVIRNQRILSVDLPETEFAAVLYLLMNDN